MSAGTLPTPPRRGLNPDIGFWICFGLTVVNAGVFSIAPNVELAGNALTTAGVCGLGAFLFWVQSRTESR